MASRTSCIDPRRLVRLAAAAREAGITRLKLSDGTEFDLGSPPAPEVESRPAPMAPDRPDTGSLEGLRRRFERRPS